MSKEKLIDKLWESSNHGTRREDVEAAYNAGASAERECSFVSEGRKVRIGSLEVNIYRDSTCASITKHYNNHVKKEIELNEDEIYQIEFAIKEIKRQLNLGD